MTLLDLRSLWDRFDGAGAATQAAQSADAAGLLIFAGTAGATQPSQAASASGALSFVGTGAATQASQSADGVGALTFAGTAAAAQAAQTAQGAGLLTFSGTATAAQLAQTADAAGALGFIGAGDATQAAATADAAGTVPAPTPTEPPASSGGGRMRRHGRFAPSAPPSTIPALVGRGAAIQPRLRANGRGTIVPRFVGACSARSAPHHAHGVGWNSIDPPALEEWLLGLLEDDEVLVLA